MPYLLDSNVFIQAKNFYYGFDFAPGFWDWIDREHTNGNVFSVERVRDELIAAMTNSQTGREAAAKTSSFLQTMQSYRA